MSAMPYRVVPADIDETFARILLSKSANPNVRCRLPGRLARIAVAHTMQSRAMLSRTLMYGAAIMDNAELLRLLFEKGADANAENGRDYHDALDDSCHNGRDEVVKVLLANGSSVPLRDAAYYRRVVEEATVCCHGRVVELLLTEGHGFRAQSKYLYCGSLQRALDKGYDEIAKILVDNDVEIPGHA
jgi:ankyrin repeat protein